MWINIPVVSLCRSSSCFGVHCSQAQASALSSSHSALMRARHTLLHTTALIPSPETVLRCRLTDESWCDCTFRIIVSDTMQYKFTWKPRIFPLTCATRSWKNLMWLKDDVFSYKNVEDMLKKWCHMRLNKRIHAMLKNRANFESWASGQC